MTISKKMLFAGLLAISTQFGAFAKAENISTETMCVKILSFAQNLRQIDGLSAKDMNSYSNLANALEAFVQNNYGCHCPDGETWCMFATINAANMSFAEKVAALQRFIAYKEAEEAKKKVERKAEEAERQAYHLRRRIVDGIREAAVFSAYCGVLIYGVYLVEMANIASMA